MKFKRSIANLIWGFGTQMILMLLGIVVPRLILLNYGSESNGLLNTVTQVYTYVALLEAGVGTATIQALYKPIVEQDVREISAIYNAADRYYKRLTIGYFIGVALITVLAPMAIRSEIRDSTIRWVVFFEGMSGVVTFFFVAAFKQLLTAEGKNYSIAIITFLVKGTTYLARIFLAFWKVDLVALEAASFFITVGQMLVYRVYFVRQYPWINKAQTPDFKALKHRNAFLVHEISQTIFNSTDVVVLSTACSLIAASIYTVYNLVVSGLSAIMVTAFNGVSFVLGQTYHVDLERYKKLHDAADSFYMTFVFSLMSVAYLLLIPFVTLYTKGVADASYVDPFLPILFCLIQLLSAIRAVSSYLINIAQHAKQTIPQTITEATINLIVSIVLAHFIGIYGVLIGTIAALLYRSNDIILYANLVILKRSPLRTYIIVAANALVFAGVVLVRNGIEITVHSYFDLVGYGLILTPAFLLVYLAVNVLVNRDCLVMIQLFAARMKKGTPR